MKLLLVEDETMLSNAIEKGLKKLGYAVDAAYDGEKALEYIEISQYDLMILDLNLPKVDGLTVLKTIRKTNHQLKVIILSARTEIEDKISGLDLGANDYLEKPFDFGELAARIRNLLRWTFEQKDSMLTFGPLTVNILNKTVIVSGETIELTKKEYGILEYLAYHKDCVVSAEELIEHVWDSDVDLFSNTFKFHMHSLKKKLPVNNLIKNIRGQGYILNTEGYFET